MDKAHQVAPVIAVLHRSNRAFTVKAPDLLQNRLEADAMLIHSPQFDLCRWESGRDHLDKQSDLFLNASWAVESALTWPWFAALAIQTHQVGPAQLHTHGASQLLADPRRNGPTDSELAFGSRPSNHGREFRHLLRQEQEWRDASASASG